MLIALTREVAPSLARCELTHPARTPIDVGLAARQHEAYEAALREAGCTVVRANPEPDLPDSVFVEDTAVVFDEVAVVTRPGAASRRRETESTTLALRPHRRIVAIEDPGTLDGGDVLVAGKVVYVGVGARSNAEGLRQFERLLAPHGYRVRGVEVTGCLHLKSAATLVSASSVLVNPAWVDPRVFAFLDVVPIDPGEPSAANALLIRDRIVYSPAYPRTRAVLERRGSVVVPVDLGELAKAEGALTCCSLVFRDLRTS
jgi:dimethylargininase